MLENKEIINQLNENEAIVISKEDNIIKTFSKIRNSKNIPNDESQEKELLGYFKNEIKIDPNISLDEVEKIIYKSWVNNKMKILNYSQKDNNWKTYEKEIN